MSYAWFGRVELSGKRDFDRLKRQQRTAAARQPRPLRPLNEIREVLTFRCDSPEHKAGNLACLPFLWDDLLNAGRIGPYLLAHRKRDCLVRTLRLDVKGGDRAVRIRNDDVEALGLPPLVSSDRAEG